MSRRIRIKVDDVVAEATLYDEKASKTTAALWERLPIHDRTIQVHWSGDAWRTEKNHELQPKGAPVENVAGRLGAGDIIYFPGGTNIKIGFAYGKAQWLNPFMEPLDVAHIGKIDTNLDAFVKCCEHIMFEGPLSVEITRIEEHGD